MNKPAVLGIDTSCYTTSLAVAAGNEVMADVRRMLPVPPGSRGLRQADGFYHHHRALPQLITELKQTFSDFTALDAIAYSKAPRPVNDSYMPVFTAGEDVAITLAEVLGIPLIPLTHQEGHVCAASWGANFDESQPFLAVHLSGGTTEILKISPRGFRYSIELLSATKDISAGMLIDRTGVMMGFGFPAGQAVDKTACECSCPDPDFPICVRQGHVNFSGLENSAKRLYEMDQNVDGVSLGIMSAITRSIAKMLFDASIATGINRVLFSGGVASSNYIRRHLKDSKKLSLIEPFFCKGKYSVDNAVGIAIMGARIHGK